MSEIRNIVKVTNLKHRGGLRAAATKKTNGFTFMYLFFYLSDIDLSFQLGGQCCHIRKYLLVSASKAMILVGSPFSFAPFSLGFLSQFFFLLFFFWS